MISMKSLNPKSTATSFILLPTIIDWMPTIDSKRRLTVIEKKILRWINGVTYYEDVKNEIIHVRAIVGTFNSMAQN